MLSVLLTLLCLGGLLVLSVNQFKMGKLMQENVRVNKSNLNYRNDSSRMSYEIESLINASQEMTKYNNILKRKHDELINENKKLTYRINKLEERVVYLEEENRKINRALETHHLIASNLKVDKPFLIKMVK